MKNNPKNQQAEKTGFPELDNIKRKPFDEKKFMKSARKLQESEDIQYIAHCRTCTCSI